MTMLSEVFKGKVSDKAYIEMLETEIASSNETIDNMAKYDFHFPMTIFTKCKLVGDLRSIYLKDKEGAK